MRSVGAAEDPGQTFRSRVGELSHRLDSLLGQARPRFLPHAPQRPHRQPVEEGDRGRAGYEEQAVGFRVGRGDLGDVLRRGDANRRRNADLAPNARPQIRGDADGPSHEAPRAADVEKGLVHRKLLHKRGDVVQYVHDLPRHLRIPAVARRNHRQMRAGPKGAGHGHCRVDAEFAGLVGGGGDDAALGSPDGDRLPRELRAVEQLD